LVTGTVISAGSRPGDVGVGDAVGDRDAVGDGDAVGDALGVEDADGDRLQMDDEDVGALGDAVGEGAGNAPRSDAPQAGSATSRTGTARAVPARRLNMLGLCRRSARSRRCRAGATRG
jgi:hypothetical protein